MTPDRIHLISHANPLGPDLKRFGFEHAEEYVAFARRHLPRGVRLTCDLRILRAVEDEWHGGRDDDALRIRDLNAALADARTQAIVAANGGGYLARILPHLDFAPLARRERPLWALGFSELTNLVNVVASYRGGRGLYWLCPNWMGWNLAVGEAARAALAEFWHLLPDVLNGGGPATCEHLRFGPIEGQLVAGRKPAPGRVRLTGGCLAVIAAAIGSPLGRRYRPDGKWLILEDIKENPYRIDRYLATLKLAGWFARMAGLVVGDFRMMHADTQPAVLELLRYHLPSREIPVVTTRSFGHVWPMVPVLLNRPVRMEVRGRAVRIG
jgi:muramoyltetrapeptide carboxypeptidase